MMEEKMSSTIETISAEDLYYTPIPKMETEMIVEDMIPQGLTILAGPPKSGKSWFVLDMGICVSAGTPILGKETLGCGVLYFALEDRRARLQDRFHSLSLEEPPVNLYFATRCPPLGGGLLRELDEWLRSHPAIRLVIIDTLQKIRGDDKGTTSTNQYGKDSDELSKLKNFADNRHIGIVIVHHVTKKIDPNDPVNDIRGSTGMSAIPDNILILRKGRVMKTGELLCVSRDLPQWKMILTFNEHRWHMQEFITEEEIAKAKIPPVLFRIADLIKRCGRWEGTLSRLLEEVGEQDMTPNVLSRKLAGFGHEVFLMDHIRIDQHRRSSERRYTFTYQPDGEQFKQTDGEISFQSDEDLKNVDPSLSSSSSQMSPEELRENVERARKTVLGAPSQDKETHGRLDQKWQG